MFFVCFLFPISHFFFFFLFCTILYVFYMFSFSYFILFCILSFSNFICIFIHLLFLFLMPFICFSCSFLYFLISLFCTLSNIMYITCTIHTTTCGMGFSFTQHYEGKRLHG